MSDHAEASRQRPPETSSTGRPFIAPDWRAPLDTAAALANVPRETQVAGMFFLAVQARAKQLNIALPGERERYMPFNFYPLIELIPMMVVAGEKFYSAPSLREGLRQMGRLVPKALIASTVGKVVFGSTQGVHDAVEAMAKTYGINLRPSRVEVLGAGSNWSQVRLDQVHHFLDSHHVGVFEGVMLHAQVQGEVRIAAESGSTAELLLTW